jgi:aldose sugar dehydrogenase
MQARRALVALTWLFTLGVAFLAGAFAHKYRAQIRARMRALQGSPVIQTNLYNLRVEKLAVAADGRDGALDVLGEGLLVAGRRGEAWYVTKERTLRPIALRVPINVTEFETDPFNAATTDQNRFSVKDLLVQPLPSGGVRILATYLYWHKDRHCNVLRVASIESTAEAVIGGQTGPGAWRTLLESSCRELNKSPDGKSHHVTLGVGGRLAPLSSTQVLLTVGEFTAEYDSGAEGAGATDLYGKTALIDVATGAVSEYSRGHRNAQGLAVGADGRVWETEHGARGGDELNLLVKGKHYGAPHLTYGTQYEMLTWPRSKTQARHDGYEKPIYAWVPSIAPSQLVVLRGTAFPWWAGDLLVSSLESRTLYRVRVEEDRVIFVEPFFVGHRVRDLVEMPGGTIALKTDDDFIVFLDNLENASAATLDPVTRGAIVGGQCRSCHSMTAGAPSGIGPNLWGVIGRPVASAQGYAYSEALRRLGGTWTEERLRAYVSNPGAVAPGTRMQITSAFSEQQLSDLLAYLRTQR